MTRRTGYNRRSVLFLGILLLSAGILSGLPTPVSGQDTLSLSVDRNVGLGFGNIIQGSFTLRGSGPTEVQNLTVYFNGEQVHFVTGNTIAWQFNTGDYTPGSTNITLFGLDDSGGTYSATRDVFILSETMGITILGGVMVLVVILVIAKYGPMLRKKKKSVPS